LVITDLEEQRNETLRSAYAEGTKSNLETHWDSYREFCHIYRDDKLQTTVESLSLYIQFLSNRLKSPGAIKNYVSGVKTMHVINDLSIECFDDFLIRMMMRGVTVRKKHKPKKAKPMTPELLKRIHTTIDMTQANDCTFWALFVTAFYLLARKSNLVPDSVKKFNPGKQLTRGDVEVTEKALLVTLKWSKTNQVGREEVFPLLKNKKSILCPAAAYKRMIKEFPAKDASPAFMIKKFGKLQPVTYRQYQARIKKAMLDVGEDPEGYTSHSFRRGGATYAFKCGVSAGMIKRLGDWKSDAYLEYIDFPIEDRITAGQKIRKNINKLKK